MEPERPIEKLLRAFAKKRREDAGANFQLHPATRRMLQGEAARTFGKSAGEKKSFFQSLLQYPQRLAWAVAVVGIVALLAAIILPAFKNEKNSVSFAKNEQLLSARKPETMNAPAPTATPAGSANRFGGTSGQLQAPEKNSALLDTGKDTVLKKEKLREDTDGLLTLNESKTANKALTLESSSRDEARTRELAAASPSEKKIPTEFDRQAGLEARSLSDSFAPTVPAPGASAPPASTAPSALGGAFARSITPTAPPATAPTVASAVPGPQSKPAVADALRDKSAVSKSLVETESSASLTLAQNSRSYFFDTRQAVTNSQAFKQVALSSGTKPKTSANRSPAPKVLTAFQFEQNGSDVRILDADGSIYNGYLQLTNQLLQVASDAAAKTGTAKAYRSKAQPSQSQIQSQSVQNVLFRVAGTNKSLKEKVVFTGTFLGLTNAEVFVNSLTPSNQSLFNAQNGSAQNSDLGIANFLNTTISGKAQIGNRREVEIKAIPVSR